MNAFFKSAGAVLRKIWVWSLLLVLLTALLVWCFGPLLAVDDHRFWQGATARLLTICVLFLSWGVMMVIVAARQAAHLKRPDNQAYYQHQGLIEDERRQVTSRFKDALCTLKASGILPPGNALPWYLLIGQQGSGKSCLLAASGQGLPLASSEHKGSTSHVDWHFTEQGILVEVAGRYLAQNDPAVDGSGWTTLLGLLKSRRVAVPVNGVVVTLSVDVLQDGNEHDLERHARHVQTRLQDIQQTLRVDVPVYLVLTHADRLHGFAEFFEASPGESGEGVLGECLDTGTRGIDRMPVRQSFEALLRRLAADLIPRLHQERDVARRGRILDFPRQVARRGDRLCQFIELAFSPHGVRQVNNLRGFYLTSAGQERRHFVQGVFNQVILADAHLAGLRAPERKRMRRRQTLMALAVFSTLGALGGMWLYSYSINHQRLEQLAQLGAVTASVSQGADATRSLLPLLDSRLAATRVFPASADVPVIERIGLFQGDESRPVLTRAYHDVLQRQLLSQVAGLLEEQVRQSLGDREQLLDNLRAYLMLNLRERRDKSWLAERVAGHWSARYAAETSVQHRLNEHFARLLEQPFITPLNDEVVAEARQALRGESLADVVYRSLREQSRNLESVRLTDGVVFADLEQPVPGFYTRRYLQFFEKQGPRLVNAIAQDNWVLGESSDLSAMDLRRLMGELEQRYFSEYATVWSNALAGIRLQPSNSIRQGAERLASLASAQSPLLQVLLQVRENTRLLPGTDPVALAGRLAAESKLGPVVSSVLTDPLPVPGEGDAARRALQRRFEPLHQLLDEQQNPGGELTQVLRQLDTLQMQLATLTRDGTPEQAAFQMVKRRMEGQPSELGQLRDVAARLPMPLKGWFEAIADEQWSQLLDEAYLHVNQHYQGEVYGLYARAIRQRYPFNAHASSDVALSDFQEFFKPHGVLARFHETYLRPFISTENLRYRLRSLDGRSLPISRGVLDQLSKAQVIRRGFFSEDQGDWAVRFTLAPYSLDQAVSRAILRVGDQQLEYRHGPIVPMAFNWPDEADGGRSSLVLERGAERPLGIEKNSGAWSLFRFFDLMQNEPASGRNAQLFKADLAGLRANYLLVSQRTPSPFQMDTWRTFRLPEQL
ncbi:type VI secretion system membrane subunit TssM [Pseudomonas sp. SDO524_S393]